jgi:hypothetical protein
MTVPPVPCADCPTMEWVRTTAQRDVDEAQAGRERLERRVEEVVLDRQTAWLEINALKDRLAAVEAERDGLLVERRQSHHGTPGEGRGEPTC